jgi:hypothetical protein
LSERGPGSGAPLRPFGELFDKLYVEKAITRDLKYAIESFKSLVEVKVPALV